MAKSIEVVEVRPHERHYGVYVVRFEDGTERNIVFVRLVYYQHNNASSL